MKKITKNSTACLFFGALFLITSLLFAPIWNFWKNCPWKNWGSQIINLLIAICIVLYLIYFLAKKVKGPSKRAIKVLTIVEFTILSLIALGCIFSQFKIINVQGACQIFGLALWTRGTTEIFRAYYYRADSKEVYPVWYLALSIAFVSFGVYCFAKPFIKDIVILWIFVAILFVLGVVLLSFGTNKRKTKKLSKNKSK